MNDKIKTSHIGNTHKYTCMLIYWYTYICTDIEVYVYVYGIFEPVRLTVVSFVKWVTALYTEI